MKATIYKDRFCEFRWRTTNGGNITATCHEGYTRRSDAVRAWERYKLAFAKLLKAGGGTVK